MEELIEKMEEVQVLAEAEGLELSDLNDINTLLEKFRKLK